MGEVNGLSGEKVDVPDWLVGKVEGYLALREIGLGHDEAIQLLQVALDR